MPVLPLPHVLLAIAVVAVWGTNFVVIRAALDVLPPLLLGALRFALALLPAALLVPRPRVPLANLAGYGMAVGAGQFGLLYLAIDGRITPGLASLVVQTQVFFTIGLAMWLARERLQTYQVLAVALGAAGLVVVGLHTGAGAGITVTGVLLVLGAAFSWAVGNLLAKRAGSIDMLAYVVWSSVFAVPVLLGLSLLTEGWPRIEVALAQAGWGTWAAVAWQAWANTLFGYGAWNWLLARNPAAAVAPMALLVPVFGMGASAVWLREPLPPWKLAAGALVLGGLALNLLWPLWRARR
jgi:O-acetylserine/cysteine efflux transporter